MLFNGACDVDVPGSFDYLQLFALVVDQKRGNHGQLELCFQFLWEILLGNLPEAESLFGVIVAEPDGRIVGDHTLTGPAPVQIGVYDY